MVIKKQKKFKFNESTHKYFIGKKQLESVTTFISKFFSKFDMDNMSKVIARCINKEFEKNDFFYEDGFPKLVKLYGLEKAEKFYNERKTKTKPITPAMVKKTWKKKGKEASEHGTRCHNAIEEYINNNYKDFSPDNLTEKDYKKIQQACAYLNIDKPILQSEVKVYDEELGLAGTIDGVIYHNDDTVTLIDWKTNEQIKEEGYKGKKALEPIEHLPDCELSKYSLQLNVYKRILEQQGIKVKDMYIIHLREDGYTLKFIRDMSKEVKGMVEYNNKNKEEEEKAKEILKSLS